MGGQHAHPPLVAHLDGRHRVDDVGDHHRQARPDRFIAVARPGMRVSAVAGWASAGASASAGRRGGGRGVLRRGGPLPFLPPWGRPPDPCGCGPGAGHGRQDVSPNPRAGRGRRWRGAPVASAPPVPVRAMARPPAHVGLGAALVVVSARLVPCLAEFRLVVPPLAGLQRPDGHATPIPAALARMRGRPRSAGHGRVRSVAPPISTKPGGRRPCPGAR